MKEMRGDRMRMIKDLAERCEGEWYEICQLCYYSITSVKQKDGKLL